MIALLQQNHAAIKDLCRRYGVNRLDVFGSATTDAFDSRRSDLDFLVEFKPNYDLGPWMKHYFELRDLLANLLGRDVDLVMADSVTNPYLKRAITESCQLVYASEVSQVA